MTNPMTTVADHLSIFQYYRGREYAGNRFELSPRPERFKRYHGPHVRLKTSIYKEGAGGSFASLPGTELLERILLPSFGVTSVKFHGHQSELLWSFPSAGGCYPVEIYVVVRRLGDVEPGIYSYSALQTTLYRLGDRQAAERLGPTLREADKDADLVFVLSVVPWRTCWKYSHKGYRFSLMDAGHVAANFQLVLRAMGFPFSAYTCLRPEELGSLLRPEEYEVPVAMIAVRVPSPQGAAGFLAEESSGAPPPSGHCEPSGDSDIHLFDWEPIVEFQRKVNRSIREPSEAWLTRLSLPAEWTDYGRLLELIIGRRSSSAYSRCELRTDELLEMLDFISRLELHSSFHLIVHGVEGLRPGLYRFADGELGCLAEGDYREKSAGLCLGQAFIRDCSVLFVFTIDASRIPEEQFSLYQQSSIDGGIMGQLIYLKSQEMGLGFSIIGGYYDQEVRDLLRLEPSHQIVCAGSWGRDAPNSANVRKNDRYIQNKPER